MIELPCENLIDDKYDSKQSMSLLCWEKDADHPPSIFGGERSCKMLMMIVVVVVVVVA